jgi:hypothetical protein|tara:strand:+ start:56 stop:622 length:567 start_codon:yes stop_codon:yes gene_type:complete
MIRPVYFGNELEMSMIRRMIGSALLQANVFEEVEHDHTATLQAALVVIIVSISTALGSYFTFGGNFIIAVAAGIIFGLGKWVVWAFITYIIGTKLFNTEATEANWGQMARGTAFSQSPGVLFVFAPLPVVGQTLVVIVSIWQLCAMTLAVKQVLDYRSIWRAVGVVVVGFLVVAVPMVILQAMVGVPA